MRRYLVFILTEWRDHSNFFAWLANLVLLGVGVGYIAVLLFGALQTVQ